MVESSQNSVALERVPKRRLERVGNAVAFRSLEFMMSRPLLYEHIGMRSDGAVIITPSGFKVRMLAERYLSGSSVEDLHEDYPFLTFGQIHAALAYDWDYKEIVDAQIAAGEAMARAYMSEHPQGLSRAELLERLKLREVG